MSDSTLRTAIARALHQEATDDGEVHILWGGAAEHEAEVSEWLPFADAVLKVLSDPPAEVVERCAESIAPAGVFGTTLAQYSLTRDNYSAEDQEDDKNYARADVRAVLAALVGGEQS